MNIDEFFETTKKIKDIDFLSALGNSFGKINPFEDHVKFRNMHKGTINIEKVLKTAINKYFISCTSKSIEKYPKDVVQQVKMELQLKKEAIGKLVKLLKLFPMVKIEEKTICKMGCKTFGCYFDHPGNAECDRNFCRECK